jgi:CheY-like chemotaxis protein
MPAKVLIVDDDPSIADLLPLILSPAGYQCSVAYDGFDALHRAAEFHPDLIISDVMMPGMNGIELAKTIVDLYPDCHVLLFSGSADTHLLGTLHAGGHTFPLLAKPVLPRELLAAIAQLLEAPPSAALPSVHAADNAFLAASPVRLAS